MAQKTIGHDEDDTGYSPAFNTSVKSSESQLDMDCNIHPIHIQGVIFSSIFSISHTNRMRQNGTKTIGPRQDGLQVGYSPALTLV
ncbi:hypothetical protein AVEN_151862-1 [Araneus ventricosus]|uniref:Uncharacterized protein n=1 Tax=Araneus ventricosus TaxID=182803 RepID=A0A4Y2JL44_ARAVE|nr:hypothetical protein AVEN_151862-1 [Araneus ventricosus]